ncbi:MAG: apolipoprotein N-acyltransferase [Gammaproteobacteria bacterium]|nr:MAG: apolipoprotein N-acyltransferase [Gammaproteobacteria bacterium]
MSRIDRIKAMFSRRMLGMQLTAVVFGLFNVTSYAPFGIFIFSIVSPLILLMILTGRTTINFDKKQLIVFRKKEQITSGKVAFYLSWLYGFAFFLGGVHWIYVSISQYGSAGALGGIAVVLFLSAALAIYTGLAGLILWKVYSKSGHSHILITALLFPAIWVLMELARSYLFTGFPWLILGNSVIDGQFAALLPVVGSYGVSFILISIVSSLFVLLIAETKIARAVAIIFIMAIFLVAKNFSGILWTKGLDKKITASVVQGNIAQDEKWKLENRIPTIELYYNLSEPLWKTSDVIVWPETAIPSFYTLVEEYVFYLSQKASAEDKALIFGIINNVDHTVFYNSVMQVGKNTGEYRKQHLVMFGEYLPLRQFFSDFLDFLGAPMSDLAHGKTGQPPFETAGYKAGVSVCFEIAFSGLINNMAGNSNFLVNISNDGWFGTSIGPHQHFQIARVRAAETGKPLIRSTNTGISAIIDADGAVIKRTKQFEQEVATASFMPRAGNTPYVEYGDLPVLILSLTIFILTVTISYKRKKSG